MKLNEILFRLFSIVFICLFIYINYTAIFNTTQIFYSMNAFIIIIGSVLGLIALYFLYNRFNGYEAKRLRNISIIMFLIMLVLQLIFTVVLLVKPSWDYATIMNAAIAIGQGNQMLPSYFYLLYPNNIGVTLILGYIFKILNLFTQNESTYLMTGIFINIIVINLAIYILYKFIKQSFGGRQATLLSIFILFLTPFYTYAQIVYTDTLTMIFPIAMFFLLYKYMNCEKIMNKAFFILLIAIFGTIGMIIKTNIVIALIAIIIYLLLTNRLVELCKNLFLIFIPFLLIMGIHKTVASNFIPVEYDEMGLPATHWLMMGLSPNGQFYQEDVDFSVKIKKEEGKEATLKANLEVIDERLNELGVKGYLSFVNRKVSNTWSDGTYYATSKLARQPINNTSLHHYIIGEQNTGFIYLSQFSHVIVLVGILIGAVKSYKKPTEYIRPIHICILGVFLFLIIWETRSRYLVCFLPVLIYASFYGLISIFDVIDDMVSKND